MNTNTATDITNIKDKVAKYDNFIEGIRKGIECAAPYARILVMGACAASTGWALLRNVGTIIKLGLAAVAFKVAVDDIREAKAELDKSKTEAEAE